MLDQSSIKTIEALAVCSPLVAADSSEDVQSLAAFGDNVVNVRSPR